MMMDQNLEYDLQPFPSFFFIFAIMGMYTNWTPQSALILSAFKWYTVNNTIDYLHKMRSCIIGKKMVHLLNLISSEVKVDKQTRFPGDIVYLCEGIGTWNLWLDQLLLAKSILTKERSVEGSSFKSMGQVELYALEKINQLLLCFSHEENVINQQRFESIYHLIWIEKDYCWLIQHVCLENEMMPVAVTGFLKRIDRFLCLVRDLRAS